MFRRHITLLFGLVFLAFTAMAGSVRLSVDAARSSRTISVGETFYIKITVTDIDAQPSQPSSVPGARVVYFTRTGQSSSITSVNGKTSMTSSTIYTVTLKAEKEGSFSFGPITVGSVKSNVVQYSIGKAQESNGQQTGNHGQRGSAATQHDPHSGPMFIGKGDGNLFLKASVSKTTAYEQEALVYIVKLYTSYSAIKFIGATTAPKFEGFVIEESKDISQSLTAETYQGKTYATAVIARYIIFPQMAGTLKILGNKYTVSVDEREYYHDPLWGEMSVSRPLQLNVTPNDLSINVKELPTPRPTDFSGGVGHFSISSSMPKTNLKTGQAAQVIYTVSGTGNLKYIKLPDLNTSFPKEIEVYSPTTDVKDNVGSNSVSGSVRFDYSFMPMETGEYSIPPVKLIYFDPSTGKYEEATSKGYTISVGKGNASEKSQTRNSGKFDPTLMRNARLQAQYTPYIAQFTYWLFYIVPVLALIIAIVLYRRHISLNSDLMAVRARKAAAEARRRLKKARICMQKGDEEHFYDQLLAGLWGYLGDKLKISPSDLSRENVSELLREHGVSEESIDKTIQVIDEAEFAKYSPASSRTPMQDILRRAADVIALLQ